MKFLNRISVEPLEEFSEQLWDEFPFPDEEKTSGIPGRISKAIPGGTTSGIYCETLRRIPSSTTE